MRGVWEVLQQIASTDRHAVTEQELVDLLHASHACTRRARECQRPPPIPLLLESPLDMPRISLS